MKFISLHLTAFGKFHHKIIELNDGFNLIFGVNEAGKTTIAHFIEGMLFGFYKPYRKKRAFSEAYYRYKPWNEDQYCGAMILEDDTGKRIRIERDFLKLRDGVRIYDQVTGEDISAQYPYDNVNKQYLLMPREEYNAIIYNNTVNVKQGASVVGGDLAKEVNDHLVGLATDRQDRSTVAGILSYVAQCRKEIGSMGKSSSPYGKIYQAINDRERSLTESEETYDRIEKNEQKIRQYQNELKALHCKIDDLKAENDQTLVDEQAELDDKVCQIGEEINALRDRIEACNGQSVADPKEYTHLVLLSGSLEAISERLDRLDAQVSQLSEEKMQLEARYAETKEYFGNYELSEIKKDYEAFKLFDYSRTLNDQKNVSSPQKESKGSFFVHPAVLISGLVLGLLIAVLGFLNPSDIFSTIPQILIIFIGLCVFGISLGLLVIGYRHGESGTLVEEAERVSDDRRNDFSENEMAEAVLKKYYCQNDTELEEFFEESMTLHEEMTRLSDQIRSVDEKKDMLMDEFNRLSEKYDQDQGLINDVLFKAGVESVEAYGELCQLDDQHQTLVTKLEAAERLYDTLQAQALSAAERNRVYYGDSDVRMRTLELEAEEYVNEIQHLTGENHVLLESVMNPVTIREGLESLQLQAEDYERDLKALDLVEQYFNDYAKDVHKDSVPDINRKIGEIIYRITGKYRQVHLDDKICVRVEDPQTGMLLSLDQLSGGTVDQLNLALRFGVADVFNTTLHMPLCLDEPFVQYDDERKKVSVNYLAALAKERQVLLFTCTAHEKRILDEGGSIYNGIGI